MSKRKPQLTPEDAAWAAKFRAADPDGEGLRSVVVNAIANMPAAKIVEMGNLIHRGAKFPAVGRRKGAFADTTKLIRKLSKRIGSAQWLFDNLSKADKLTIGAMSFETFRGHVSRARPKKPKK